MVGIIRGLLLVNSTSLSGWISLTCFHGSWLQLESTTWKLTGLAHTVLEACTALLLGGWREISLVVVRYHLFLRHLHAATHGILAETRWLWLGGILPNPSLWGWLSGRRLCLVTDLGGLLEFSDEVEDLPDVNLPRVILVEDFEDRLVLLLVYIEIIECWARWRGLLATTSCIHSYYFS